MGGPGCAVAAVRNGRVELAGGWGLRDRAAGLPVTEDTLFAIGSTTKAFTATTIGALVDEGLLEWEDFVRGRLLDATAHSQWGRSSSRSPCAASARSPSPRPVPRPAAPPLDLVPLDGLRFGMKNQPAVTAQFELGGDGAVTRLVAQPLGIFLPKDAG